MESHPPTSHAQEDCKLRMRLRALSRWRSDRRSRGVSQRQSILLGRRRFWRLLVRVSIDIVSLMNRQHTGVGFTKRLGRALGKTNVLGLARFANFVESRDGFLERRVCEEESQ